MTIIKAQARTLAHALLAVGLAAGAATAAAQQSGQGGGGQAPQAQQPSPQAKAMMQAQMRVRKLQQQISKLQNKALEQNPELKKQRENLDSLINDKMKAEGVNPDADMKRLQAIRDKIRQGDVGKQEQQKLAEEFRSKRGAMMKARRSAMQNKEVQASRKAFRDELMAAMKEVNPEAEQLVADFRQALREFREQRQKAGGGQQPAIGGGNGG